MDFELLGVHWGLAVAMFFALNWIGKLAQPSGYLTLDMFVTRDNAPAFNFVFRVFGPVVFIVVAACLLYAAQLDRFVHDIWHVIVYQLVFRLIFNLSFGRYLLLNFRREVLVWTVSIGAGWVLSDNIIQYREYLFPKYSDIANNIWVLVALFIYSTLNNLSFDGAKSIRRKNQYLYSAYGDYKHQYQTIVSELTQDRLVESIAYSIMIYEGFNRPSAARILEHLLFPMWSKTLGPMQIKTDRRISDKDSVRIGVERVIAGYQDAIVQGEEIAKSKDIKFDPTLNPSHRRFALLRVAAAYNKDDTYATEIEGVHEVLSKEFYKEFCPPKPPRRSDWLIH